eukprot:TRINITY_DN24745_c0_g1_i1.p1 TRINITY_DN24745_c0_g1~~TRINITY_DN24745_c0_g1_i1.p1  ORF type:complete len:1184 (+),score=402.59 TRINITY_DN24745_c0_g1_i1:41-3553(+)
MSTIELLRESLADDGQPGRRSLHTPLDAHAASPHEPHPPLPPIDDGEDAGSVPRGLLRWPRAPPPRRPPPGDGVRTVFTAERKQQLRDRRKVIGTRQRNMQVELQKLRDAGIRPPLSPASASIGAAVSECEGDVPSLPALTPGTRGSRRRSPRQRERTPLPPPPGEPPPAAGSVLEQVLSSPLTELPPSTIPTEYFKTSRAPVLADGERALRPDFDHAQGLCGGWVLRRFPSACPTARVEVLDLAGVIDDMNAKLRKRQELAKESDSHAALEEERQVWDLGLSELVRQVGASCAERGMMLKLVREAMTRLWSGMVSLHDAASSRADELAAELAKSQEQRPSPPPRVDVEQQRAEHREVHRRMSIRSNSLARIESDFAAAYDAMAAASAAKARARAAVPRWLDQEESSWSRTWREQLGVPTKPPAPHQGLVDWIADAQGREASSHHALEQVLARADAVLAFETPSAEEIAERAARRDQPSAVDARGRRLPSITALEDAALSETGPRSPPGVPAPSPEVPLRITRSGRSSRGSRPVSGRNSAGSPQPVSDGMKGKRSGSAVSKRSRQGTDGPSKGRLRQPSLSLTYAGGDGQLSDLLGSGQRGFAAGAEPPPKEAAPSQPPATQPPAAAVGPAAEAPPAPSASAPAAADAGPHSPHRQRHGTGSVPAAADAGLHSPPRQRHGAAHARAGGRSPEPREVDSQRAGSPRSAGAGSPRGVADDAAGRGMVHVLVEHSVLEDSVLRDISASPTSLQMTQSYVPTVDALPAHAVTAVPEGRPARRPQIVGHVPAVPVAHKAVQCELLTDARVSAGSSGVALAVSGDETADGRANLSSRSRRRGSALGGGGGKMMSWKKARASIRAGAGMAQGPRSARNSLASANGDLLRTRAPQSRPSSQASHRARGSGGPASLLVLPAALSQMLSTGDGTQTRARSLKWINSHVLELYDYIMKKMQEAGSDDGLDVARSTLSFFLNRYGLRKMAEGYFVDFVTNAKRHADEGSRFGPGVRAARWGQQAGLYEYFGTEEDTVHRVTGALRYFLSALGHIRTLDCAAGAPLKELEEGSRMLPPQQLQLIHDASWARMHPDVAARTLTAVNAAAEEKGEGGQLSVDELLSVYLLRYAELAGEVVQAAADAQTAQAVLGDVVTRLHRGRKMREDEDSGGWGHIFGSPAEQ